MKLQGKTSRVYKGKEYLKQWVVIPNSITEELKWKKGEELKAEVKDGKLVIDRKEEKED